jgi:hypothetical protein
MGSEEEEFEAAGDAGGGLALFGIGGAVGQSLAGGDEEEEEFAVVFTTAGAGQRTVGFGHG